MQGDGCFTGSRTALDDDRAVARSTNDCILFGLNCRDNITHATVTSLIKGAHQRAFALKIHTFGSRRIQQFILKRDDGAPVSCNVAPSHDTLWVDGSRLIEGHRYGSSPVDQEVLAVGGR